MIHAQLLTSVKYKLISGDINHIHNSEVAFMEAGNTGHIPSESRNLGKPLSLCFLGTTIALGTTTASLEGNEQGVFSLSNFVLDCQVKITDTMQFFSLSQRFWQLQRQ